jgi:hypothetical protein
MIHWRLDKEKIMKATQYHPIHQCVLWLIFLLGTCTTLQWYSMHTSLHLLKQNIFIEYLANQQETYALYVAVSIMPVYLLLKCCTRHPINQLKIIIHRIMHDCHLHNLAFIAATIWLMSWAMNAPWMTGFLHRHYQITPPFCQNLHLIFMHMFFISACFLSAYTYIFKYFSSLTSFLLASMIITCSILLFVPTLNWFILKVGYAVLGFCAGTNALLFTQVLAHNLETTTLYSKALWFASIILLLSSLGMKIMHHFILQAYFTQQHYTPGLTLIETHYHCFLVLIPLLLFAALLLSFNNHRSELITLT